MVMGHLLPRRVVSVVSCARSVSRVLRMSTSTNSNGGSISDGAVEAVEAGKLDAMVEFRHVAVAAANIKDRITKTPCQKSLFLSEYLGLDCFLKKELFQQTGSFKERGALNRLLNLSDEQKKHGVVAASAGNHALVRI